VLTDADALDSSFVFGTYGAVSIICASSARV
jgi:hypothetical protein